MSWIRTIPFEESSGRLREIYERVHRPGEPIDAILRLHSLRPHTLQGHLALYKSVLHHSGNTLPRWLHETLGVYVSLLNGCDYCVAHHEAGLRRLLQDEARADEIRAALESRTPERAFQGPELAALQYAAALTRHPERAERTWAVLLREAGFQDEEILEINQVVSYFAYANRTVLGLGATTEGDVLGLSPSNEAEESDWLHQ